MLTSIQTYLLPVVGGDDSERLRLSPRAPVLDAVESNRHAVSCRRLLSARISDAMHRGRRD